MFLVVCAVVLGRLAARLAAVMSPGLRDWAAVDIGVIDVTGEILSPDTLGGQLRKFGQDDAS